MNGIVSWEHLAGNELLHFLASFVVNLVIAAIVFVLCGGLKLTGARQEFAVATAGGPGTTTAQRSATTDDGLRLTAPRIATLVS